jgi:hydroxylamine dehydrogenase
MNKGSFARGWRLALIGMFAGIVCLIMAGWSVVQAQGNSPCITCHTKVTPGIVAQWQAGVMGQKGLDCAVCHGSDHKDASDAAKAKLPTPDTCKTCHPQQVEQFRGGKHALAWVAMQAAPMLSHQPMTIVGPQGFKGCSGCHKIGEKSAEELKSEAFHYGTGSCDSCHTRHTFAVSEARDPRACQTCHMGFDHPQWEMWSTSKHGTVWAIEGDSGRAPTCQTCHMKDGDHGVMTAWGFLALRVPEEDEEWWKDRVEILQALGVLDEKGQGTERLEAVKVARVARLTREEFDAARAEMTTVCQQCHAPDYVAEQLGAGDEIIREADKLMATAIRTVKSLYADGILKKPAQWKYAPDILQFYEAPSNIEQELYVMFLEYRMRAFQGAFHANPDYMHWYGWAAMKQSLRAIEDEAASLRAQAAAAKNAATLKGQLDKALAEIARLAAEVEKLKK